MIWFAAVVVLALALSGFCLVVDIKSEHRVYWDGVLPPFFATLIFGGIVALVINIGVSGALASEAVTTTNNLTTLQDGSQTTGTFFLGSGYVDGKQVFSYYEKRGGAYYLESIDAEHAKVVESSGQPRVEHTCDQTTSVWISVFSTCWNNYDYTFYVPKGSVVTNYTLDAK